MITAIWAQDINGLIGKNEGMPWHLPDDLKFFRTMTENNTIVMGRKTFEGMGKKALPNRKTLVLTSDKAYAPEVEVGVVHSIEEVLLYDRNNEGLTFIAGGAAVYKEFLPHTDTIYRTMIFAEFSGDTYFPEIDWDQWSLLNISVGETDEKNLYPHQFEIYQRKQQ